LAACQPKTVIVEKVVKETVEVEKEKIVEKEVEVTKVVEKEVTKIVQQEVEKVVTATPMPEEIEIVWWDSNPDPGRTEARQEYIAEFEERHPGVKGKYVPVPIGSYQQKLMTAIGSGRPPDVGDMWGSWVASYASMGALLDLEPHLKNWALRDNWLPWLFKLGRSFNDTFFWFPSGQFVLGIFYRSDWLQEAGMPDPWEQWQKGEWTWEALLEACKAMTDASQGRYGIALRGGIGAQMSLFTMMQCWLGGQWFDEEGNCLLNLDEGVEAVSFYADLWRQHKVAPPTCVTDGYQQIQTNFSTEVCGLYMHSADGISWQYKNLRPDPFEAQKLFATAPVPAGPAGSWQQLDGLGSACFAQAKNPDIAAQFLFETVNPDDFDVAVAKNEDEGMPLGYYGLSFVTMDNFERPEFLDHPHYPPIYDTLLTTENTFINPFHLPGYNGITATKVVPEFQKILLGEMEVKEAVDGWAAEFTKAQKTFLDNLAKSQS
jgi:multiple sugar transport system substrate-binding protein